MLGGVTRGDVGRAEPLVVGHRCDEHELEPVEVDPVATGAIPERTRSTSSVRQQVVEQVAAEPVLGLGSRAAEEQHERGHHRAALEGPSGAEVELGRVPRRTTVPRCSAPARAAATQTLARLDCSPGAGATPRPRPAGRARLPSSAVTACPSASWTVTCPFEHLAERGRELVDLAAAEQHDGEPVVGGDRRRDGLGLLADPPVGVVELGDRPLGRLEEARVLQGDGGVSGERGQQGDLVRREGAHRPVDGQERPDDLALDEQRYAEDRPDPLVADGVVDVGLVPEPLVVLVVVGVVRRPGLGDQPEQSRPERQPELTELARRSSRR